MKLSRILPQHIILKLSGGCGLILPFVFFCSIALALSYSSWFDWFDHALSDLGIQAPSAFFFNGGMIVCGLLVFIFSFGLPIDLINKKGVYFLRISGFSLVGIGFFPQNIFLVHYLFSIAFFISLMISLFFLGDQEFDDQRYSFLASMAKRILIFEGVGTIFSFFIIRSIALAEAFIIFPTFLWVMLCGSIFLSKKHQHVLLYHSHDN